VPRIEIVEADDGTTVALKRVDLDRDDEGALWAELHQRRSIALACLAFVLLGVPLAIRVRPTGKAIAFSIAFGLILFYYGMLKWGVSLSQSGSALGAFVIFLPNFLVGGVGVLLFIRTVRR
jgi:lipopolysaccharide export system permease protein